MKKTKSNLSKFNDLTIPKYALDKIKGGQHGNIEGIPPDGFLR